MTNITSAFTSNERRSGAWTKALLVGRRGPMALEWAPAEELQARSGPDCGPRHHAPNRRIRDAATRIPARRAPAPRAGRRSDVGPLLSPLRVECAATPLGLDPGPGARSESLRRPSQARCDSTLSPTTEAVRRDGPTAPRARAVRLRPAATRMVGRRGARARPGECAMPPRTRKGAAARLAPQSPP